LPRGKKFLKIVPSDFFPGKKIKKFFFLGGKKLTFGPKKKFSIFDSPPIQIFSHPAFPPPDPLASTSFFLKFFKIFLGEKKAWGNGK